MVNTEPRSGAAEDQSRSKKGQQFHAVSNISWSVKFQFYLVHFELFFLRFLIWFGDLQFGKLWKMTK